MACCSRNCCLISCSGLVVLFAVFAFQAFQEHAPPRYLKRSSQDVFTVALGHSYGAAFCDVDNDGDDDLFAPHFKAANQLLLNDGAGHFHDVAENAGVSDKLGATRAAIFGDVNGDGKCDLYITHTEGSNKLFINKGIDETSGILRFNDETSSAGVGDTGFGQGASFADVDGDGDLDLFVANLKQPNMLYINDGHGTFVKTAEAGLNTHSGGSSVAFGDIDDDGDLDLYVSFTDGVANKLYFNDGHGHFTENNISFDDKGDSRAVSFVDVDGDGDLDLFVANIGTPNRLFINDGTGHFICDQKFPGGLDYPAFQSTQGVDFGDLDGDGDLDMFVTDGGLSTSTHLNNGMGSFTRNESFYPSFGQGIGMADVDHDGDLDIYVCTYGNVLKQLLGLHNPASPNALYENVLKPPHWLKVRPKTSGGHATLLGTHVRLFEGGTRMPVGGLRMVDGGSGLGSQNAYDVYFGLGAAVARGVKLFDLELRKPGGEWVSKDTNPKLGGLSPNQIVEPVIG